MRLRPVVASAATTLGGLLVTPSGVAARPAMVVNRTWIPEVSGG
jgi:hypothetical protein